MKSFGSRVIRSFTARCRRFRTGDTARVDALQESEARKSAIVEAALDCLITMDGEGRVVDFNPVAEKTFGYSREEALGRSVAELIIPPRLRESHWQGFNRFLQTGKGTVIGRRIEMPALRADGSEIPVELAISAIQLKNESPFFAAYLRDISERKRAERALQRSVERFKLLSETAERLLAAADGSVVVDELFPRVAEILECDCYFNYLLDDRTKRMRLNAVSGVERDVVEESLDAGFGDLTCDLRLDDARAVVVEKVQETEEAPFELLRAMGLRAYACHPLRVRGRTIGSLAFGARNRDRWSGDDLALMKSAADQAAIAIDRIRAQQSVRESQERLQLVSDHVPALISYVDRHQTYRFNNARYADWFDVDPSNISGRHVRDVIGESAYRQRVPYIQRALNGETVRFEGPTSHCRLGERHTELAYVPDTAADGHVRGFYVMAVDITQRKRHEEQTQFLMAELNHRVKNLLAVVQSIVFQSLRLAPDVESFQRSLNERMKALATAHGMLTGSSWEGASVNELLDAELSHRVATPDRRQLRGPNVVLRPKAALALQMVVHELSTNAVKYGALSTLHGTVQVDWSIERDQDDRETFQLRWVESGGPAVHPPERTGFGTTVLKQLVGYELDGEAQLEFDPSGLRFEMSFPFSAEIGRLDTPLPDRVR